MRTRITPNTDTFYSVCIKPNVKLSPKQIILHCWTNNLPSSEDPETIAKNIISLIKNIKPNTAKVAISGKFISHYGINTRFDFNSRCLHLNDKGATREAQNFERFRSNIEFG